MSEIPKAYEPQTVEDKWYSQWLAADFFKADPASPKPAYSIVIPPPNVTGVLTLGHVLNNTIQDILARRARMLGKEVLWLPGTDHAGIATQTVVERTLKKQGAIRHRDDLGREKFLEKIWEWKEKHGGIIIQQLKKLGASCDWSRERFTMDEEYSRCVSRVFVELYKKGLIYRGKRMVNWCPASLTALSDEEVIMKPQNGTMYHFKVEVVDKVEGVEAAVSAAAGERRLTQAPLHPAWLTIATTRPETIPGDTAVAVNPKDERYAHLIGKHVRRPLPVQIPDEQKLIPIIGDDAVDFEFGTGVLKVTPAHDKADFEIGQRHNLAAVDIMNPDGTMNALAGESLVGLDRFEARNVAVDHLRQLEVLVKEEPYQNNVGYSERADVPIEPRLSEQWFLKYPSVEQARSCVEQPGEAEAVAAVYDRRHSAAVSEASVGGGLPPSPGKLAKVTDRRYSRMRFFPERWAKVYDHWLGGIQDWCISRQLWWGHRIPVWTKNYADRYAAVNDEDEIYRITRQRKEFVVRREPEINFAEDNDKPCRVYVCVGPDDSTDSDQQNVIRSLEALGFTQDPDVLDTWFSSWLWPFATMGWPEKTGTLAKFYPTADLVTGPDIIFFWVARMIMAGFEFMGEMPFRNVYFTGIIRDKQGRKMSKSLGNSPDPLDIIAKFGADALRFGVMRSAPLGADVLFDEKNVELGRNFCTKLWNASRFRQMQDGENEGEINPALLTSDDKWILLRLDMAIREVSTALDEYRFSDAAQTLYRFFWSEFCDWYLEASKAALGGSRPPGAMPTETAEGALPSAGEDQPLRGSDLPSRPEVAIHQNTLAVLDFVLAHTLRLMHPFMPFITEELWHGLGFNTDMPETQGGSTIMFAHWPQPFDDDFKAHCSLDETDEKLAAAKYETVTFGRNLRSESNIPSGKKIKFVLRPNAAPSAHDVEVLKILLQASEIEIVDAAWPAPRGTPVATTPLGELFMPLEGLVDLSVERARLQKEVAKVVDELAKVDAKLNNETFVNGAPANVIEGFRKRKADWQARLEQLQKNLEALGG